MLFEKAYSLFHFYIWNLFSLHKICKVICNKTFASRTILKTDWIDPSTHTSQMQHLFLSTYYLPGTVRGTWDKEVRETRSLPSDSSHSSGEMWDRHQNNRTSPMTGAVRSIMKESNRAMGWGVTSLRHDVYWDLKDKKKPDLWGSGGRKFLPPEESTVSAKALGQQQAYSVQKT